MLFAIKISNLKLHSYIFQKSNFSHLFLMNVLFQTLPILALCDFIEIPIDFNFSFHDVVGKNLFDCIQISTLIVSQNKPWLNSKKS